MRDLETGLVELVSRTAGGALGNGNSGLPSISGDGRWVAFESNATNFAPNDTSTTLDVYVKDRQTGALQLVSVNALGASGDSSSFVGRIAQGGRYVAFQSSATNLSPLGGANGHLDVYVRDLQLGVTTLASVTWDGLAGNGNSIGPRVTSDGRYVVFQSSASNLSPFDTNNHNDIFLRDLVTGTTTIESIAPGFLFPIVANDTCQGSDISDDGRYVVFATWADNLTSAFDLNLSSDIYLRDRIANQTTLVSRAQGILILAGNAASSQPKISNDGRHVVFASRATDLVFGDTNARQDVFVRDLQLEVTRLASRADVSGALSSADSFNCDISGDGQRVVFNSGWDGFVGGDTNAENDTFVAGTQCFFATAYCQAKLTSNGCLPTIRFTCIATSDADGGFAITCETVINQKPGLLLYGLAGPAALPFQGGTLCVQPPTRRGPLVVSGGSSPPTVDCSGRFVLDMDAYASGGGNALPELLIAGTTVNAQWWGRDPGFLPPVDTLLSNGLQYTVLP